MYNFIVHPVQGQWLHKFRSCLVPLSPLILLHLTEGLWECEKTILGHHVGYCTSFMCRNPTTTTPNPPLFSCEEMSGSRWLFPHVAHKFSPVAVLYNARLLNIAIRELLSQPLF